MCTGLNKWIDTLRYFVMTKKRKIALVVKKISFKEAEDLDGVPFEQARMNKSVMDFEGFKINFYRIL